MKSILTSPDPEKEKNSEEAEKLKEHVPKESSDEKKEKGKVSAAAMKTVSSKEKADKDLVNSIPRNFKVKLCTPACVDVVAHYKSLNLEFERQKDKALKFNKELKQNEAAYQRKLNSTLAEMQTLKEFVFRKDFIINDLTDRLEKALNENNKLQIIIDKWNVSQKAFTDIKNCQRPTNSFGKFLIEEIPEFIPSRTGMTDSEREVTEESSKEDSSFSATEKKKETSFSASEKEEETSFSASEREEETSTSNEEQKSETSSEDQTTKGESSEDSSDETNDDQNSESSSEDPSCSDSSYEASEEQNSSEYQTSESSSYSDNDE
ncbi:nucleolar transcription factor 1-like [Helianthus annuus]|uniref:nucleolar transcription factor 1-like n=1 Tax=Helianthus annuus TaxID=4232 RepID=UPI001653316C|nr:nucleolar transcription factor 1-like [Helianthus annuus]